MNRQSVSPPQRPPDVSVTESPSFSEMKSFPGLLACGNWLHWRDRETNHLNTQPWCVLMFISALSLRRERGGGGGDRVLCATDRIGFVCDEWGCHTRWQVCVQYTWMYNTLCILWQAGRLFVPIISISFHLRMWSLRSVYGGRWTHTHSHTRCLSRERNGTQSWSY